MSEEFMMPGGWKQMENDSCTNDVWDAKLKAKLVSSYRNPAHQHYRTRRKSDG